MSSDSSQKESAAKLCEARTRTRAAHSALFVLSAALVGSVFVLCQRLGASSGLMLGCLSVPLLFACQLTLPALSSSSTSTGLLLLWLSLCCSGTGLSILASDGRLKAKDQAKDQAQLLQAKTQHPEAAAAAPSPDRAWWDEALTVVILAPGALVVQDGRLNPKAAAPPTLRTAASSD